MFQSLCTYGRRQAAQASECLSRVSFGLLGALALAVGVLLTGGDAFAVDPEFPDILQPFSFTSMTAKVATYLTVAMAAMAALVVGCILAKKLLNWVGRGV